MSDTVPPRLKHNENLAREYMKRWGIVSSCPPVHEQIESVVINRHALRPGAYNPSIIRHQGRLLMAYRYYGAKRPATEIGIAELDEQFNVIKTEHVKSNDPAQACEDCRLFIFKDQLYASYVEVKTNPVTIIVKYGLLVEGSPWRIVDLKQPMIGTNDSTAWNKNFIFWDQDGKLMCLYESFPEQRVFELDGASPVAEYRSPGIQWPYGAVKGGCGPVPYQGKLLRFFHSTLDNEPEPLRRRYFLGCVLMNPNPPFNVLSISRSPL